MPERFFCQLCTQNPRKKCAATPKLSAISLQSDTPQLPPPQAYLPKIAFITKKQMLQVRCKVYKKHFKSVQEIISHFQECKNRALQASKSIRIALHLFLKHGIAIDAHIKAKVNEACLRQI